jgi:glutaredoxin
VRLRHWLGVSAAIVLALGVAGGCRGKGGHGDGDDPTGAAPSNADLPKLSLRDDTPNLLLTWIDEKGDFHVVQKIADVPDKGKKEVRVVVTNREEGTGKLVYVADLSRKNPDGSYPVNVMTRAAWDDKGASRRKERLEALAPPPPSASVAGSASAGPGAKTGQVVAIIYGAEWCKPCHDAQAYLQRRGVRVIKKDVDNDEGAEAEMKQKLARAHLGGSSIPVIDIMGQILVGFSPLALDRAIETAENAKTL